MRRRELLEASAAAMLAAAGCRSRQRPTELRLDWAYYSPLSMVLRRRRWLEDELQRDGITVRWILSLGSNKALELLSTNAVDFGSTAGSAALLSRANGNPIKAVYVSGRPEWTALVARKGSPLDGVAGLRGKRVAATKGTDPYIFLLRLLHDAGLTRNDVQLIHLQHPDGRAALERGDVEAWAGLDPHMAASELEAGSRLVVRKPAYNTPAFLNVREGFAARYPDVTARVLRTYERARRWARENPGPLLGLVSEEAKIPRAVAERVLHGRYSFEDPIPGPAHVLALDGVAPILRDEGLTRPEVDPARAVGELIDPAPARAALDGLAVGA